MRLTRIIEGSDAQVDVSLQFRIGDSQKPVAVGSASVVVQLVCQACMEQMDVQLEARSTVTLVGDATELDSVPPDEDGMVVTFPFVSPTELLEDEMILSLPMVPRHSLSACSAESMTADEPLVTTHRPFAGLSRLIED